MLNPVEVTECPTQEVFDQSLAEMVYRLRSRLNLTTNLRRTSREMFYAVVRSLGVDAPIVHESGFKQSAAFWYRDPYGHGHLVLGANGLLRFHQGVFLLVHHLLQLMHPSDDRIFAPFDDLSWQNSPHYAQHRLVFVALMTNHLNGVFQPIY